MKLQESDLEWRKPVWLAFSNLFLDTDVSTSYEYIARVCAQSPYRIEELYDILTFEVTPVLYANLFSVAGEWAGFDEQWLYDKICHQLNRNNISRNITRFLSRHLFKTDIDQHWQILARQIEQKRAIS